MSQTAVCLLSGGLDSTTALYKMRADKYDLLALTVDYGQLHVKEIDFACKTAARLSLKHHRVRFEMPWGGSALTDGEIAMPTQRTETEMRREIPATYVPARNSIMLAFAASLAETENAHTLVIGANVLDYSGYPDCRPEFLEAFEAMIRKGTKAGDAGKRFRVMAPLLRMTKKEIILLGRNLGVPFEDTWSCYQGQTKPCGVCDSCLLRAKGFREAGLTDPLLVNAVKSAQSSTP